jgi:hypothetical protein
MAAQSSHVFWGRVIGAAKTLEVLIKGVGPVIAVLWIGWQYQQSRIDKRVEATLDYVKRFEGDDTSIGKAQRALTDAMWRHEDEIADLQTTQTTSQELQVVRDRIVRRILEAARDSMKSVAVVGPMDEMDDFFNALATCIQGSVCDEDSALRYFGCSVAGYVNFFEPEMKKREALAPSFGWGLRWISERTRKGGPCGR